jgi:hypothetical protein
MFHILSIIWSTITFYFSSVSDKLFHILTISLLETVFLCARNRQGNKENIRQINYVRNLTGISHQG